MSNPCYTSFKNIILDGITEIFNTVTNQVTKRGSILNELTPERGFQTDDFSLHTQRVLFILLFQLSCLNAKKHVILVPKINTDCILYKSYFSLITTDLAGLDTEKNENWHWPKLIARKGWWGRAAWTGYSTRLATQETFAARTQFLLPFHREENLEPAQKPVFSSRKASIIISSAPNCMYSLGLQSVAVRRSGWNCQDRCEVPLWGILWGSRTQPDLAHSLLETVGKRDGTEQGTSFTCTFSCVSLRLM